MDEKPLYGALTVYRERGAYLRRLEQFDKAKNSYDVGYKDAPEDVALLIGRSQVCADAMKPDQAYNDAEAALKVEPRSMLAKNVQCRALYTMSEFERSVVMNYRGSRARRFPPYFTEGIIQGLETIQDCIGKNAGQVMLDFLPIISEQEAKKALKQDPPKLHKCRIPKQETAYKMTQDEKRKHDILSRVLAMKYLGPMAYDKFFLQELQKDRRIPSANAAGSEELKRLINEALDSLCERQEMLRAQRPYYSIKLAEKTESKYLTKYRRDLLEKDKEVSAKNAERFILEMNKSLRANRLNEVIAIAERMQAFLDSKTPQTLPDKDFFTDRLYRKVGEGYFYQHRLSYRLSEHSNRRRVAFLMGLPVGRPTSFDSMMASYPHKFVDLDQTINKVQALIDQCENNYQRCWLYYEMARLQNTKKNFALAKFYAKRCQQQAHAIENPMWWMNGCFVLMAGDMQQGNQNDIRTAVEEAYEYSKKVQDAERVRSFLRKCADLAAAAVPPDEFKVIKQREKQILKVLDDVSKAEQGLMFKRIWTVPTGRRFFVLPRQSASSKTAPERRKLVQRGLTVVPGKERPLPAPPKSSVLGFQKFDL
ncbi:tetratricopeptide repeat protein 25 [Phthorimaea operculella]|nr:tetratricopeptide repeat protein 25 [Phthorimaea operculella]